MIVGVDSVTIRDLSENEIPAILRYWFHSPPGFIEAMGVDPAKMPRESEMKESLGEKLRENGKLPSSKLNALAIVCDGRSVGFHTISPLFEGDHGIFHAHVWEAGFRRRGIGLLSYPKACKIFLDRYDLKRIVFKTPIRNIGAIRVKEKLGIRLIGEELIGFGIIRDGTLAKVFEVTRAEARLKWP